MSSVPLNLGAFRADSWPSVKYKNSRYLMHDTYWHPSRICRRVCDHIQPSNSSILDNSTACLYPRPEHTHGCLAYGHGGSIWRSMSFFIERWEKSTARPELRVTLLEPIPTPNPLVKTAEEPEGTIQYLRVENVGGETLESCYASATLGENGETPSFNLLWPLSSSRPHLQPDKVAFEETDEKADLIPKIPRLVSLLVVARQATGGAVLTLRSEFLPVQKVRSQKWLELEVRFAGRNYQDPTIRKYRLDMSAPWNEKFTETQ